jgi:hypothetical protein
MKKAILIVLMLVLVATPCFAQEVETDGLFSIEGTLWVFCSIDIAFSLFVPPFIAISPKCPDELTMGFYQGTVYRCYANGDDCLPSERLGYIEFPLFSIVIGPGLLNFELFILQPSGFGLHTGIGFHPLFGIYRIGAMFKVNDNWTPAPGGEIMSISPNQGEQGTTLTDVTIMGADTTFEDNGVSAISLMPPGGFTVSNINVISNTEIEFDLEIAVDAPVGMKSLLVRYDNSDKYISRYEVFEVLENTN